jgi:hypothetical protein
MKVAEPFKYQALISSLEPTIDLGSITGRQNGGFLNFLEGCQVFKGQCHLTGRESDLLTYFKSRTFMIDA